MTPALFPSLKETLELHRQLIQRFGGTSGVRDKGLLESALLRPQTGYYDTLSLQAAALLQSLCRNHCFVDGNKRVAFATAAIFLRLNGYRLKLDAADGESFIVNEVIGNKAQIDIIATWLEAHLSRG
jgi:death-on-curing protein